jgi:chemotaxis protein MotB
MRRNRRQSGHPNHERWLVSYADFITLLFAFFVVMYAHSQVNKQEAVNISQAFRQAMEEGRISGALARLLKNQDQPKPPKPEPVVRAATVAAPEPPQPEVELLPSLKQLNETLRKEIDAGKVEVRMEKRGLVISLREATFFPSGTDTIEPSTMPTLEAIAKELKRHPNPIRLEGHTDDRPIRAGRFRSNWELSAARGIAMLELFSERFSMDRGSMAIAGYAETVPVATNGTTEGRSRNRRVDIVVLNEIAATREPQR